MEGKTHYEHVVGGTEEEKREALKDLQGAFEERDDDLAKYEIEKTEDDERIITAVETIVDDMVAKWHGNPKPFPLEKIYLLKPGAIEEVADGKSGGHGIHSPLRQNIGVEKQEYSLAFASTLAHELFHLKSYKSAQIKSSNKEMDVYRSGFSMIDRKDANAVPGEEKEYFGVLEEAIVAECTRRFFQRIQDESMFEEEAVANERMKSWMIDSRRRRGMSPENLAVLRDEIKYIDNAGAHVKEVLAVSENENERADFAAGIIERLYKDEKVEPWERWNARSKLYKILDEILEKSDGRFKNRDEVFDEFAAANFSGNYLSIARIIESALGKGSFRRLANEFAEEVKQAE